MQQLIVKNKDDSKRWKITYDYAAFPSQCGILILYGLDFFEVNGTCTTGKYLKNHIKECKEPFKIFQGHLLTGTTHHFVKNARGYDTYSPFYSISEDPRCARILLSDVVENKGPHMTGMFAEFCKLPAQGVLLNPNSRNLINSWCIDLPEIEPEAEDYYDEED